MRAIGLEYHDILCADDPDHSGFPGAAAASYKLAVAQFEAHLNAIAAAGACVGRVDARRDAFAGRARADGASGDGTPVYLTFDDGGAGALDGAAPSLARRGWTGHFLVTTGQIGARGFMTPAQLRELHALGHVIGSHSCTHPLRFSALGRGAMLREWRDSRAALEQALGAPVAVASVPGGYFRRIAAETAAEAGYRVLFTSEPMTRVRAVDGCVVLGRYSIRRATTPADAAALATQRLAPCGRQWAVWNAKKVVKRVGGGAYLALRERVFERGR